MPIPSKDTRKTASSACSTATARSRRHPNDGRNRPKCTMSLSPAKSVVMTLCATVSDSKVATWPEGGTLPYSSAPNVDIVACHNATWNNRGLHGWFRNLGI